jgi:plastocyanin
MKILRFALPLVLAFSAVAAQAAELEFKINIKDHKFDPALITIPAGQKVKFVVTNLDTTPEEFESRQLQREKLVPAGKTVNIPIGPLKAGEYPFMGEFNQETAQGKVIAK